MSTSRPRGQDRKPLAIAHRGASADAPENTVSAVRQAVALGADAVELDVQRSRDGALVVMHDTTLARTTNVMEVFPRRAPWRVSEFTLSELRLLDAGSWKSGRHAAERVPTLVETMDVLGEGSTGLLLELKRPDLYPGIVEDLVSTLAEASRARDQALAGPPIVVQSFDFAAMKDLKTRAPGLQVGLLGAPEVAHLPVLATWADQVNPQHLSASRSYVDEIHRHGMDCVVWTVDERSAIKHVARLGVDGVVTNRPDLLVATLSRGPRAALGRPFATTSSPHGHGRVGAGRS